MYCLCNQKQNLIAGRQCCLIHPAEISSFSFFFIGKKLHSGCVQAAFWSLIKKRPRPPFPPPVPAKKKKSLTKEFAVFFTGHNVFVCLFTVTGFSAAITWSFSVTLSLHCVSHVSGSHSQFHMTIHNSDCVNIHHVVWSTGYVVFTMLHKFHLVVWSFPIIIYCCDWCAELRTGCRERHQAAWGLHHHHGCQWRENQRCAPVRLPTHRREPLCRWQDPQKSRKHQWEVSRLSFDLS